MKPITVEKFKVENTEDTARLFYDAVHIGAANFYDEPQREAWVPKIPDPAIWRDRLMSQHTYVAKSDGKIVGFMTVTSEGYIELAFVAPNYIGKGVAKCLYTFIEERAIQHGIKRLYSEASYLAKPFFERQGWQVVKKQSIKRANIILTNFVMEKYLEQT